METDEQKIHYALNLWANYIETGNIVLCALDAQRQGEKVRVLSVSQMKMVIRLRELAQMAATGKISVQNV